MLYIFCKVGKLSSSYTPLSLLLPVSFQAAVEFVPIEAFFASKSTCHGTANGQWAQTLTDVLGNR